MSVQKFSVFHETDVETLQNWHMPYAKLFRNCENVLDVGCGPGYFADDLKLLGVKSLGIDIDEDMVRMATSRGHDALLGNQDYLSSHPNCFGGIHISHVVEHLTPGQLEVLLTNSVVALKTDGILIIRTPNWSNKFVREKLFWQDHTHVRPYPAETLKRMLVDLGASEVVIGCEPSGMNDVFVIASKAADPKRLQVEFPAPAIQKSSQLRSLLRPFRRLYKLAVDKD